MQELVAGIFVLSNPNAQNTVKVFFYKRNITNKIEFYF